MTDFLYFYNLLPVPEIPEAPLSKEITSYVKDLESASYQLEADEDGNIDKSDLDSDIQSRFSYSSGGQVIWRYTETGSGGLLFSVSAQEAQTKAEQNHAALLVDKVQSTFNLTVDETAKVCGVSRKTVYNWKDGDQPNKAKFRRLMLISMIADAWRKSDLPVTRNVLEQPIIGTQTILELLAQTDVNQDKILFAGNRIKMDLIAQAQTIEDPFA